MGAVHFLHSPPPPQSTDSQLLLRIIKVQQELSALRLELGPMMQAIAERAMELTDGDGGVVELVDGDELVYRGACGSAAGTVGLRLSRRNSLSGLSVEKREVLVCDDSETDSRVNREACRRVGLRLMICVPLRSRDRAVGVLKILSRTPKFFTPMHVGILELLSNMLATALAQAAEAEARAQLERQRQADEVTQRLASIGRLAAGIAHEINNPLSFIIANVRFALDEVKGQGNAELNEALKDATTGAQRVAAIIRDLLSFARARDDAEGSVDVTALIGLSLSMAGRAMAARARVERDLEADLQVKAARPGSRRCFSICC